MPQLHEEMLTPGRVNLLPALKPFAKNFGLVGGAAVALHDARLLFAEGNSGGGKKLFGGEFNEKLFRERLAFFGDVEIVPRK